jgi:tetratricopeptide (TPR) repeat protein
MIRAMILVILTSNLALHAQSPATLIAQADLLVSQMKEEQALEKYKQVLAADPDHYEALCNASFYASRCGNRLTGDAQVNLFEQARKYAVEALAIQRNDVQANFVMAVAMGRMALISGTQERVAASRDIKLYAERVLELDEEHAGAWHVLGVWNHRMANLSMLEKAAANLLFGGIPSASDEEAEQCFKKAIRLRPDYMLYYFDFGKFYYEVEEDDKALYILNRALELDDITQDDARIRRDCLALIEEIKD